MRFELRSSTAIFVAIIFLASIVPLGLVNAILATAAITASVILHEFGHAGLARLFGTRVLAIGISFKGGYTIRQRSSRRCFEFLTTLAGPAVNLGLCAVFSLRTDKLGGWLALSNLVLGITNLIPIGPTDGSRLLRLLTAAFPPEETAELRPEPILSPSDGD